MLNPWFSRIVGDLTQLGAIPLCYQARKQMGAGVVICDVAIDRSIVVFYQTLAELIINNQLESGRKEAIIKAVREAKDDQIIVVGVIATRGEDGEIFGEIQTMSVTPNQQVQ